MIRYIDDHVTCDLCREEVNEGFRIGYDTFCRDCLTELKDDLNDMLKDESEGVEAPDLYKDKCREFYVENSDLSLNDLMTKTYKNFIFFEEHGYILHLYFTNNKGDNDE